MRYREMALLAALLAPAILAAQRPTSVIHQEARAVPAPPCGASVLCLRDSTRTLSHECCDSSASSDWLVLPAPGDSVEFFAVLPESTQVAPYVTMMRPRRRQQWQEHVINTASFLRHRFQEAGTYVLTVDLAGMEPAVGMPYELRVRSVASAHAVTASPLRLQLAGGENVWYVVRPRGADASAGGAISDFMVRAGTYRVLAPGVDSIEICRQPCRSSSVVALTQA